jgi:hypothetical protein
MSSADPTSPELEIMLKKAGRLEASMGETDLGGKSNIQILEEADEDVDTILARAHSLAQKMTTCSTPEQPPERPNSSFDSIGEEMLHQAGKLAEKMKLTSTKESAERSPRNKPSGRKNLPPVDTTASLNLDAQESLVTPKITNVVSTDDGDVMETMLLKADLLSKTIKSASSGQIETPELLRASDAILRRAKVKDSGSAEDTPSLLRRADRIISKSGLSSDSPSRRKESAPTNGRKRPPRPPGFRSPLPPITPSPKTESSQTNDKRSFSMDATNNPPPRKHKHYPKPGATKDDTWMEKAIQALQSIPTVEDQAYMPTSVVLHHCDSDDFSSVGSESGMPNPFEKLTDQHHAEDGSSVEAAEDLARQMEAALDETLSQSSCPAEFLSPPRVVLDHVTQEQSPLLDRSNISRELGDSKVWDEHDAIKQNDESFEVAVNGETGEDDESVVWEKGSSAVHNDEDYTPLADFSRPQSSPRKSPGRYRSLGSGYTRNSSSLSVTPSTASSVSRTLGMGYVPTWDDVAEARIDARRAAKLRRRRRRRNRRILVGSFAALFIVVAVKFWTNKSSILSTPTSPKRRSQTKRDLPFYSRADVVNSKEQRKGSPPPSSLSSADAPPFRSLRENSASLSMQSIPIELPPSIESPVLHRDPQIVSRERLSSPRASTGAETSTSTRQSDKTRATPVSPKRVRSSVIKQSNGNISSKRNIEVTNVLAPPSPADKSTAESEKPVLSSIFTWRNRTDIKHPRKCFLPFSYLASTLCKDLIDRKPLFDVQKLTDCMLQ